VIPVHAALNQAEASERPPFRYSAEPSWPSSRLRGTCFSSQAVVAYASIPFFFNGQSTEPKQTTSNLTSETRTSKITTPVDGSLRD
jgi:hypothetical protein